MVKTSKEEDEVVHVESLILQGQNKNKHKDGEEKHRKKRGHVSVKADVKLETETHPFSFPVWVNGMIEWRMTVNNDMNDVASV